MLTFTVYGVAQPKGSHRAFMAPGMKVPIVTDSNRNAKSWAQLVAHGASEALRQLGATSAIFQLLAGPVHVSVAFYLPRPKKFSKRGVYVEHLTAPDIDKLLRGVLDALSQVVWQDDSQVVSTAATKRYAAVDEPPRVTITVEKTSTAAGACEVPKPTHQGSTQPALFEAQP